MKKIRNPVNLREREEKKLIFISATTCRWLCVTMGTIESLAGSQPGQNTSKQSVIRCNRHEKGLIFKGGRNYVVRFVLNN